MEYRQDGSTDPRVSCLALGLWISTGATAAWLTLWFLSGEFSSSFFAVLAPMVLLAARLKEPGQASHERVPAVVVAARRIRLSFDSSRGESLPE